MQTGGVSDVTVCSVPPHVRTPLGVARPSVGVGVVVGGGEFALETPEGGLVDAGGGFDGGPAHLMVQESLDGDYLASQLTLPATFRTALCPAFRVALRMTPGAAPAALRAQ